MWPQSFFNKKSFGCTSRVAFGDWLLSEHDGEESTWFRVANYGVFHCFALVASASERRALEDVELEPSFFVLLGTAEIGGNERELWAIQIGGRPGSEYILLSRSPKEGLIDSFEVLQSRCPSANVRDAGPIDILITRYCSLNTQAELLRLARQMVRMPAVGTLSLSPIDDETSE